MVVPSCRQNVVPCISGISKMIAGIYKDSTKQIWHN